ncbi:DUF3450 domain-containing protein [Reinekea thalattae]|uniref:DUF3450 domain-containing protein n=2 Tax=Reinekea thalattae TaxID=2593301 RepID=A0A5C8Z3S8_9GAMM|nr:DUF3450 domain-containing protein [Reinekea thalattae]
MITATGLMSAALSANELDTARALDGEIVEAAALSQEQIDAIEDQRLDSLAQIAALEEQIADLNIYRDHLISLIADQDKEADSLNQQMQGIADTRQGVVPLMYRMIAGLKQHLAEDDPIRYQARKARIERLETMMSVANVSDAEKFRRILEAYQIELDYGKKLGVYQAEISVDNNNRIPVDVLYLGRASLVARSLDGQDFWAWNDLARVWQPLKRSHATQVNQAFAMASQQVGPSILQLPLSFKLERPAESSAQPEEL